MMQKMGYFEEQIAQYLKISGDTTVTKTHGKKSVGGISRMVMDTKGINFSLVYLITIS